MKFTEKIGTIAADFGAWLWHKARIKHTAVLLAVLALISPLGFLFAGSLLAYAHRKQTRRQRK